MNEGKRGIISTIYSYLSILYYRLLPSTKGEGNSMKVTSSHIVPVDKRNSQLSYFQEDGSTVKIAVSSEEALVVANSWERNNDPEKWKKNSPK